MEAQVTASFAIMAHPSRYDRARRLSRALGAPIVWDRGRGEWDTAERAWNDYSSYADYHIVVQDDALLARYARSKMLTALDQCPEFGPVSFYAGKVWPVHVQTEFAGAVRSGASWIVASRLYWGVAVAVPTYMIPDMLDHRSNRVYDARVGDYFAKQNLPVYYTNPSLVNHAETDSLLGKKPKGRVALRFDAELPVTWNHGVSDLRAHRV